MTERHENKLTRRLSTEIYDTKFNRNLLN